jgi:hypothetical protein
MFYLHHLYFIESDCVSAQTGIKSLKALSWDKQLYWKLRGLGHAHGEHVPLNQ